MMELEVVNVLMLLLLELMVKLVFVYKKDLNQHLMEVVFVLLDL